MTWFVVPPLEALRLEMNAVFSSRDHTSDGGIGDTSHAAGKSSHNPDETGNPEFSDHDGKDEVRARDFDVNLNQPGVTAEDVVQHLLAGARSGQFWWLRYIIYNRRIWAKSGGWKQQAYTGANPHDHHFHVNTDYTQAADTLTGADYHLRELVDVPTADDVWNRLVPLEPNAGPDERRYPAWNVLADIRSRVVGANNNISDTRAQIATMGASLMTALQAIAAKDQVDEQALAAALGPAVAQAVLAGLPDDPAVNVDEAMLTRAFRNLFTGQS